MECPSCHSINPSDSRYCGSCGSALGDQSFDLQSFLEEKLPGQIERTIDAKLSSMTSSDVIQVKATEQVVDRAWEWMTRLAKVVGIPVAAVVVVLGFWGVGSVRDLEKLRSTAEENLKSAVTASAETEQKANAVAEAFEAQVQDLGAKAASAFEAQVAELKAQASAASQVVKQTEETLANARGLIEKHQASTRDLESLMKDAGDTVDEAKRLQDEVHSSIEMTQETVASFGKRAKKVEKDLDDLIKNVGNLSGLARGIADLATKSTDQEAGAGSDVKALSDSVTAQALTEEAYNELDPERAIKLLSQAIKLDPGNAFAFAARGDFYGDTGETELAIADYNKALELDPQDNITFINRGIAYEETGQFDLAIMDYTKALEVDPEDSEVYAFRGYAYYNEGQYELASQDYDRAMQLNPGSDFAIGNKAWLLSTASDAKYRDGTEGLRLAREAVRLFDSYYNRGTLAAALAETGAFDEAVAEQERAITMLEEEGDFYDEMTLLQERLELYRSRQPYREG